MCSRQFTFDNRFGGGYAFENRFLIPEHKQMGGSTEATRVESKAERTIAMEVPDAAPQPVPAWRTYLKTAFGPDRLVQWVTLVVAVVAATVALTQQQQNRQAYLWTNVYNIERNKEKLFDEIAENNEFTKCFSPQALQNQRPSIAPRYCDNEKATAQFRSLLIFYRFLTQLAEDKALPANYHENRLKQFCPFLLTPTGRYHLQREVNQGLSQAEFKNAIKTECGITLSDARPQS